MGEKAFGKGKELDLPERAAVESNKCMGMLAAFAAGAVPLVSHLERTP